MSEIKIGQTWVQSSGLGAMGPVRVVGIDDENVWLRAIDSHGYRTRSKWLLECNWKLEQPFFEVGKTYKFVLGSPTKFEVVKIVELPSNITIAIGFDIESNRRGSSAITFHQGDFEEMVECGDV